MKTVKTESRRSEKGKEREVKSEKEIGRQVFIRLLIKNAELGMAMDELKTIITRTTDSNDFSSSESKDDHIYSAVEVLKGMFSDAIKDCTKPEDVTHAEDCYRRTLLEVYDLIEDFDPPSEILPKSKLNAAESIFDLWKAALLPEESQANSDIFWKMIRIYEEFDETIQKKLIKKMVAILEKCDHNNHRAISEWLLVPDLIKAKTLGFHVGKCRTRIGDFQKAVHDAENTKLLRHGLDCLSDSARSVFESIYEALCEWDYRMERFGHEIEIMLSNAKFFGHKTMQLRHERLLEKLSIAIEIREPSANLESLKKYVSWKFKDLVMKRFKEIRMELVKAPFKKINVEIRVGDVLMDEIDLSDLD